MDEREITLALRKVKQLDAEAATAARTLVVSLKQRLFIVSAAGLRLKDSNDAFVMSLLAEVCRGLLQASREAESATPDMLQGTDL